MFAPPLPLRPDGKEITLSPPTGDELPAKGFDPGSDTYQAPPSSAQRAALSVKVGGVAGRWGSVRGAACC